MEVDYASMRYFESVKKKGKGGEKPENKEVIGSRGRGYVSPSPFLFFSFLLFLFDVSLLLIYLTARLHDEGVSIVSYSQSSTINQSTNQPIQPHSARSAPMAASLHTCSFVEDQPRTGSF
mgnify:CR=1 FL=1